MQPVTSSAVLLVFPSALLTMANHFYQYCYYILHLDFKPLLIKAVLKLACLIGQLELAVCMSVVSNIHLNPYISPGYLYSKVLWIPALFSELSEVWYSHVIFAVICLFDPYKAETICWIHAIFSSTHLSTGRCKEEQRRVLRGSSSEISE